MEIQWEQFKPLMNGCDPDTRKIVIAISGDL